MVCVEFLVDSQLGLFPKEEGFPSRHVQISIYSRSKLYKLESRWHIVALSHSKPASC